MPTLYKIVGEDREMKDQGSRVESISWNEDGTFKAVTGSLPEVGCSMLVGSVTARSYSSQDYWLTTPVTEVLEIRKNEDGMVEYARFKTKNSDYEIVA